MEESGTGARQISLPGPLFSAIVIFLGLFAGLIVWVIFDYRAMKHRAAGLGEMESLSAHYEKQIDYLGERIQRVRGKLKNLDQHDKELREIARVTTGDEGHGLVGVGGSDGAAVSSRLLHRGLEATIAAAGHGDQGEGKEREEEGLKILEWVRAGMHLSALNGIRWPARGWICDGSRGRWAASGEQRGFRKGVDIAARADARVRAPASGVITTVEWREGYGRRVVMSHGFGLVSVFSHLEKVQVAKGDHLRQGEAVATVGGTGRSKGSYLHYELRLFGVPVDPRLYLASVAH
jgi:murein DD-endopeptidase MepM/ murein hydrolase activator NlpD